MSRIHLIFPKLIVLRFTLILAILSTCFIENANAQSTSPSANALRDATRAYTEGDFPECLYLLEPFMKGNGDNQYEIFRLLAMAYLQLNNDEKADECVKKLLQHNPSYKDFPFFDPAGLTKMINQYKVWSTLGIGASIGTNFNKVRMIRNYAITPTEAIFKTKIGYQIGVVGEYFLKPSKSINTGFLIQGLNYQRIAENLSGWDQDYSENLRYTYIPISMRFEAFSKPKFVVMGEIGLGNHFLGQTSSNLLLTNRTNEDVVQHTADFIDKRKKMFTSLLFGSVFKYPTKEGIVTASLQYSLGLNNLINKDMRYNDLEFIMANQYIDNDLSFNTWQLSVGYQFRIKGFYKVEKVK